MDFIIDNWTDIHIEIIIYQNKDFRYVAENIDKLKEKCNKKNIPVFDDKILSLTKIFNDRVFEKYGFDYLLNGIHNLILFNCYPCYVLKDTKIIKKNCFKEKNRIKILNIL
jgi:hypothetical protein